jgi:hypothetical protein
VFPVPVPSLFAAVEFGSGIAVALPDSGELSTQKQVRQGVCDDIVAYGFDTSVFTFTLFQADVAFGPDSRGRFSRGNGLPGTGACRLGDGHTQRNLADKSG